MNVKKLEKEKEQLKGDITSKNLEVLEKERNINKNNKERKIIFEELEQKKNEIRLNLQEIETWKKQVEQIKNMKHKVELQNKAHEGIIVKKDAKINELNDQVKLEQGKPL